MLPLADTTYAQGPWPWWHLCSWAACRRSVFAARESQSSFVMPLYCLRTIGASPMWGVPAASSMRDGTLPAKSHTAHADHQHVRVTTIGLHYMALYELRTPASQVTSQNCPARKHQAISLPGWSLPNQSLAAISNYKDNKMYTLITIPARTSSLPSPPSCHGRRRASPRHHCPARSRTFQC